MAREVQKEVKELVPVSYPSFAPFELEHDTNSVLFSAFRATTTSRPSSPNSRLKTSRMPGSLTGRTPSRFV